MKLMDQLTSTVHFLPCQGMFCPVLEQGGKGVCSTFIDVMIHLNLIFSLQFVHLVLLNLVYSALDPLTQLHSFWMFFL